MYDYYLFDLDNCLLHIPKPREYFDNILIETLKHLSNKKDVPDKKDRDRFWTSGEMYLNLLSKWGVSGASVGPIFWKYFDEIDFKHRKDLINNGKIYLYNDVIDVLEELCYRNKKIGLVSNTADYIVGFFIEKFKLSPFFSEILGLGHDKDQAIAKPSPKGILHVLHNLDYDPKISNAIMVGDSHVDVFAAKRANIAACLLKRDEYKYSTRSDWKFLPDYEIDNLKELLTIAL